MPQRDKQALPLQGRPHNFRWLARLSGRSGKGIGLGLGVTNFPYCNPYRESFYPLPPGRGPLQTDPPTRAGKSRRLTVLSQAERNALYGLPDFDDFGVWGASERKTYVRDVLPDLPVF